MFLHENREDFRDLIEQVADETGRAGTVIEKDYYVTLILRLLSEKLDHVVFKGGTSLSKGFHAINRFSEDDRIPSVVKMETALGSYSFPTEKVSIGNYIGDYLKQRGRDDLADAFSLEPFVMQLQSLSRTYIDKIFALCDYYMQGRAKRCSRHLYDIYKLSPRIEHGDDLKLLYEEVREHRASMKICPSAQDGVNVPGMIREFCENEFYREDYKLITDYFSDDYVAYEDCVTQLLQIASWIEKLQ